MGLGKDDDDESFEPSASQPSEQGMSDRPDRQLRPAALRHQTKFFGSPVAYNAIANSTADQGQSDQGQSADIAPPSIEDAPVPIEIPRTVAEALASPYGRRWQKAILDEVGALVDLGVLKACRKLPKGAVLLRARIIFAYKVLDNRFKARLIEL